MSDRWMERNRRAGEARRPRRSHKPEFVSSNLTRAINSLLRSDLTSEDCMPLASPLNLLAAALGVALALTLSFAGAFDMRGPDIDHKPAIAAGNPQEECDGCR